MPAYPAGYAFNANFTYRPGGYSLTWNHENRLARVSTTGLSERYVYGAYGQRVTKTTNGVHTLYPFPHYEISGKGEEVEQNCAAYAG
jgi:YD repeat-containing protein